MNELDRLTDERNGTHGSLRSRGDIAQRLKDIMRCSRNWHEMQGGQREALDMIMHKISRILDGMPEIEDHWLDVAGYAYQVVKELRGNEQVTSTPEIVQGMQVEALEGEGGSFIAKPPPTYYGVINPEQREAVKRRYRADVEGDQTVLDRGPAKRQQREEQDAKTNHD